MHSTAAGQTTAWIAVVAAVVANIAGYALDLYQKWWWFDRVLHSATLFAMTLWVWLFVFAVTMHPERARSPHALVLIVAVGVAMGAVWEILEWIYDLLTPMNSIKGKYDTILDIIMDTIGAGAAALLYLLLAPSPAVSTARDSRPT